MEHFRGDISIIMSDCVSTPGQGVSLIWAIKVCAVTTGMAVVFINILLILAILVLTRVCFFLSTPELGMFFRRSFLTIIDKTFNNIPA